MLESYYQIVKEINVINNRKTFFYFLITYGVCKKRKYCNRMSEKKKKILSFWQMFMIFMF